MPDINAGGRKRWSDMRAFTLRLEGLARSNGVGIFRILKMAKRRLRPPTGRREDALYTFNFQAKIRLGGQGPSATAAPAPKTPS